MKWREESSYIFLVIQTWASTEVKKKTHVLYVHEEAKNDRVVGRTASHTYCTLAIQVRYWLSRLKKKKKKVISRHEHVTLITPGVSSKEVIVVEIVDASISFNNTIMASIQHTNTHSHVHENILKQIYPQPKHTANPQGSPGPLLPCRSQLHNHRRRSRDRFRHDSCNL